MVYHTTMNLMWCDIDVTANKCQVKFWHNVCVCTIWVYLHWHLFTYGRFWKIGRSMQTSNILIDLIGLPVQQNDQYHMENRHSKWVNQINTWLFSISWKWLRKSTPTIIFLGFPMFLTNVMHLKKLMYLKYVMQIYFPFEKHKLSISRIWPYGSGGFLLG